jgi:serine/threonine-protein kinase
MKNKIKILLFIAIAIVVFIITGLLIFNNFIMPAYVSSVEVVLPNFMGMDKNEAIKILDSLKLKPVLEGPRYDARYEIDQVLFQNPSPGKLVKENRRVYLHISGGEQLVKMPNLRMKTYRDGRISLERLGLFVRSLERIRSEFPPDVIIDQEFEEGTSLSKGDSVSLQISIGARLGQIEVPYIIARSLSDTDKLLRRNNLYIGEITYVKSRTLLTNTIIDQYPPEGSLLGVGDSVDIWVAKGD